MPPRLVGGVIPMMKELVHDGALWGLIFSTSGVAMAMMLQQRQSHATIYLELTARISQLFHSFSIELRVTHLMGTLPSAEQQAEVSVGCFEYFSLICAAYQLYQGHYFAGSLWRMLGRDIERMLRNPALRHEWEKQRHEFASFPNFTKYMDQLERHSPVWDVLR